MFYKDKSGNPGLLTMYSHQNSLSQSEKSVLAVPNENVKNNDVRKYVGKKWRIMSVNNPKRLCRDLLQEIEAIRSSV
jgi:hypothetical protein